MPIWNLLNGLKMLISMKSAECNRLPSHFGVCVCVCFSHCPGRHVGRNLRSSQADHRGAVWTIHMGTIQGETMKRYEAKSILLFLFYLLFFIFSSFCFLNNLIPRSRFSLAPISVHSDTWVGVPQGRMPRPLSDLHCFRNLHTERGWARAKRSIREQDYGNGTVP